MALKQIDVGRPVNNIEAGVLKKMGMTVLNDKIFIDERKIKADRKTVGAKAKRKGGAFERTIATLLSMWWTNGMSKKEFAKTPRSGAWKFPQDLVPPEGCPFLISCKHEERWTGAEKTLYTDHRFKAYWEEVMESYRDLQGVNSKLFLQTAAVTPDKIVPMVIFTKNHDQNYLMIRWSDFTGLTALEPYHEKALKLDFDLTDGRLEVALLMVDDFLDWVSPEVVMEFAGFKRAKAI